MIFAFLETFSLHKKISNIIKHTMTNGVAFSPLDPINTSRIPGTHLQETGPMSIIDQERRNEAICDHSNQSPHVRHNNEFENVRNSDAVDKICDCIIKIFSGLGRILGALFKGIGKMVVAILDGILDLMKNLTEKLREIINYSRSDIIPLAANTAQGIQEGAHAAGQIMGAIHGAPVIAAGGGIATILPNLIDNQHSQNV
jgi:hypothetical protein